MPNFVLVLVLALLPFQSALASEAITLLTVTGDITKTNRAKYEAFNDALFAVYDQEFERAYTFNREQLLGLPQRELTTHYPNWPRAVAVTGPLLKDILTRVGAQGGKVTVRGLDGYFVELTLEDIATTKPLLALNADGQDLSIGGRGPLWLVAEREKLSGEVEDDAGLVWAVFHVRVE